MDNQSNINNNNEAQSPSHNSSTTIEGVSHFIRKLRDILTDENKEEYHRIISWNDEGDVFIIKNATKFSKHISPKYYKHSNFASFVRQLNSYGFTKVKGSSQCIAKFTDAVHKFKHPYFKRDRPDLLPSIYRKSARPYHSFSYYSPPSTKREEGSCVVASTSPPPSTSASSSSSSPPPSSSTSSSPDRDEYMNYAPQNYSSHHHHHPHHSHPRQPQNDDIYHLHRSRSDDHHHNHHHNYNLNNNNSYNNINNVANLLIAKKTSSYPSPSFSVSQPPPQSSSPSSDRDHYRTTPMEYKSNALPYKPPTSAPQSPSSISSSLFQPMIMLKNAAVDRCVKESISPPVLHAPPISSPSSDNHLSSPNLPCRNSSINHLLNNPHPTHPPTSNVNNYNTTDNNNQQYKMNLNHYINNNNETTHNNNNNNNNSTTEVGINSSSHVNNNNNSGVDNSSPNNNNNQQQQQRVSLPPIAQWEKMISRTLEFDTKLYVYGQKSEVYNSYSFKPSAPPKRPVDEKPNNLFYDLCSKDIPSFVTISRTLPPHTY